MGLVASLDPGRTTKSAPLPRPRLAVVVASVVAGATLPTGLPAPADSTTVIHDLERDTDKLGFLATDLGCKDARPFCTDRLQVGFAGSVETFDLEADQTATVEAGAPHLSQYGVGVAVSANSGILGRPLGSMPDTRLILEARDYGSSTWRTDGSAVTTTGGIVTPATLRVNPARATRYRCRLPDRDAWEGSTSGEWPAQGHRRLVDTSIASRQRFVAVGRPGAWSWRPRTVVGISTGNLSGITPSFVGRVR